MVEDIIKILKLYHDKKEYADVNFFADITGLIADNEGILDYIKGLKIDNNPKGKNSRYSFLDNVLVFNIGKLMNNEDYKILGDDYYGMCNLMALKIIIHELEHVRQEYIKDLYGNTVEGKLLILSDPTTYLDMPFYYINPIKKMKCFVGWERFKLYYDKYYHSVPYERMAILRSCINVEKIINESFIVATSYYELFNYRNMKDFNNIILYKYKLLGEFTNSPSLEYLFHLFKENKNIVLRDKSLYNFNMPSEDRVLYGLVLSHYEYENIDDIKGSLMKKLLYK